MKRYENSWALLWSLSPHILITLRAFQKTLAECHLLTQNWNFVFTLYLSTCSRTLVVHYWLPISYWPEVVLIKSLTIINLCISMDERRLSTILFQPKTFSTISKKWFFGIFPTTCFFEKPIICKLIVKSIYWQFLSVETEQDLPRRSTS